MGQENALECTRARPPALLNVQMQVGEVRFCLPRGRTGVAVNRVLSCQARVQGFYPDRARTVERRNR